ncbi:MAG: hypothetical protein WCK29_03340 [archaeon]
MGYELVLDPSGNYLSSNGQNYKGHFKPNHLNPIEKAILMTAARNTINSNYILEAKIVQRCFAFFDLETRLKLIIDYEESKS